MPQTSRVHFSRRIQQVRIENTVFECFTEGRQVWQAVTTSFPNKTVEERKSVTAMTEPLEAPMSVQQQSLQPASHAED